MKKIFLYFFVLSFAFVLVLSQKGIHEPGTGLENPELKEAKGTGQGLNEIATTNEVENKKIETEEQAKNSEDEQEIREQNREQLKEQDQNKNQTKEQNQERKREEVKEGKLIAEGKELQIERKNNQLQLKSQNVEAKTNMRMLQEEKENGIKLKVQLSNGKDAEIKVMPDTASERALERLRLKVCTEENNCQIELKEVGNKEQVKVAYEIKAEKQAKLFGLFKTKMQVQAQVDAENGNIIQEKKPWWAFLAKEE
ncbi:MAG: hypothetical protein QW757_02630 [Candidatus Woesearchaeota archaeon]